MIPERPRPKMLPLRDTETGHTPELPASLPLLNAVNALVRAAGVKQSFETDQLFTLVLERPNGLPLIIGSYGHIAPHGTEKRHLYVGPVVYIDEGSETDHGGYVTDPDISFTETGVLLRVELKSGRDFHAYSLEEKDFGTLRRDISVEERQFAEAVALSVAERLSTPEWVDAAHAYKGEYILHTSFTAVTMSRATLIEAGFPEEQIVALTDIEMEQLAARMGKAYREKGFPEDVQTQTRRMLEGGKELT